MKRINKVLGKRKEFLETESTGEGQAKHEDDSDSIPTKELDKIMKNYQIYYLFTEKY